MEREMMVDGAKWVLRGASTSAFSHVHFFTTRRPHLAVQIVTTPFERLLVGLTAVQLGRCRQPSCWLMQYSQVTLAWGLPNFASDPMTPCRGLVNTLIELPCEPTANWCELSSRRLQLQTPQTQLSRAISFLREKVCMSVLSQVVQQSKNPRCTGLIIVCDNPFPNTKRPPRIISTSGSFYY